MVAKDWYLSNMSAVLVSTEVCINERYGDCNFCGFRDNRASLIPSEMILWHCL